MFIVREAYDKFNLSNKFIKLFKIKEYDVFLFIIEGFVYEG